MTIERPPQSALDFAEKNFRPIAVEADLYRWWEESGFFTPAADNRAKPFVMMLPLPNVTGDLHLGHALGFGGYEDLMARYHRMRGEPTLYMPGTDHAGIIAQVVVENELAKEGITRQQLGREKFLAQMWKWMDHYRPRVEKQLRMLGCSLDWFRPHFTMEPAHQRAVRTHFIRLHGKGHLYRADRIVHWCLRYQTTYSDLEVRHIERTDTLYYVRYPWADPMPPGTPPVIVATTRPETIVADVAVAVHPDDARWKSYVGKEVLVPGVERRVKIIADEAVDPAFGTGALKITPGHDQTDFEIGQRHGLPVLSVIDKHRMMPPAAGPPADPTPCTRCRSDDIYQDPDVLDTWFSSGLWPFSTLGWPDKTPDLERYYPGSVLETGYDILFFWVARMIMLGLEHMGEIPFQTVYLHGLVRVGTVKMSKSLGNVVSPVDFIQEYGADALRYALVHGIAMGADSQLSQNKLDHARNFANKLWNISRFVLKQVDEHPEAFRGHTADQRPDPKSEAARWILSRTDAAVAEATRLVDSYLFGEYLVALESFIWNELADFYVELAKPSLRGSDATEAVRTLAYVLGRSLRLLHPSMPFLTETIAVQLWKRTGKSDDIASLVVSPWPKAGERDLALEERFGAFIDVVRAIRNLRQEGGLDPSARANVSLAGDTKAVRELLKPIGELTHSEVSLASGGDGAAAVVRAIEIRLAVERDESQDGARLQKDLEEARTMLQRSRDLLAKPGFADKAPKEVVEKEKKKLKEREDRMKLLEAEMRKRRG